MCCPLCSIPGGPNARGHFSWVCRHALIFHSHKRERTAARSSYLSDRRREKKSEVIFLAPGRVRHNISIFRPLFLRGEEGRKAAKHLSKVACSRSAFINLAPAHPCGDRCGELQSLGDT